MRRALPRLLLPLSLLSCGGDAPKGTPGSGADGADTAGAPGPCPPAGQALARVLTAPGPYLPGAVAVGTAGDLLLQNHRAAFVITAPDTQRTYYYYGGVLADAAPMDGCAFGGEDKLDEVAPVMGTLNLTDFGSSVLRGFRGTRAEVLADGADGGPAIVRVEGTDDIHWLVEYTLIGDKIQSGGRPVSSPYGLRMTMDFVLEPDSEVLRVDWTFENTADAELRLLSGHLLSFGPTMDLARFAQTSLTFGGFGVDAGIPYLVTTDGAGAYGFTVQDANLAYIPISGIDVALDLNQALTAPIVLPPGGRQTRSHFLAVGATDGPSATGPLTAANPNLLPNLRATPAEVRGAVVDPDGAPVAGARLHVLVGADRQVMDIATTDAAGEFRLNLPAFSPPWSYAVQVVAPGREPVEAEAPGAGALDLRVGPASRLRVDVQEDGAPVPAKLSLRREDGLVETRWSTGADASALRPGHYRATITRGYEYAAVEVDVTVPEGGEATVEATLERVVDTRGWISADTHVHSELSPDSRTPVEELLWHAAAHGLDVVVHTEHENLQDGYADVDPALRAHVASVIGQEVTATMPEHMTMLAAAPDGTERGGFVPWYGMDLAELFAAMRARSGGGINIFNHPGFMWRVGWDPIAAAPTVTDPTLLGLRPDQQVWSWDFDAMEVMNGLSSIFAEGNGRFTLWQSALNAGHRVTAVASSDDHSGGDVGFPRTYVPVEDDAPDAFQDAVLLDGLRAGTAVLSAGAFIEAAIDGVGPGGLAAPGALSLRVQAMPQIDIDQVVVFANCAVLATVPATAPDGVIKLDLALPVALEADATLVVAAFGDGPLPDGLPGGGGRTPRGLTNAIYVDADGDGAWTPPGGQPCADAW
ncbi:MAG: hypothetical protein RL071_2664 [Pseudomonadota bacterium]